MRIPGNIVPDLLKVKNNKKASKSSFSSSNNEKIGSSKNIKKEIRSEVEQSPSSSENEQHISVPKPFTQKDESSSEDSESETDAERMPIPINPKKEMNHKPKGKQLPFSKQTRPESSSSGSGSEDFPLPKIVKKEKAQRVTVPIPMNVKKEIAHSSVSQTNPSESDDTSDDSDETFPVPKIEKQHLKNTSKAVAVPSPIVKKQLEYDSGSETDDEMPQPKINSVKNDHVKHGQKVQKSSSSEQSDSEGEGLLQSKGQVSNSKSERLSEDESDNELGSPYKAKQSLSGETATKHIDAKKRGLMSGGDMDTPNRSSIQILQNVVIPPRLSQDVHWEEKFTQMIPNIEKVNTEENVLESIPKDVCILRIPRNMDPCILINHKLKPNKESRFQLGNKYFAIKPIIKKHDPVLMIANSSKILNIDRIYTVEKDQEIKKEATVVTPEKLVVPFPNNLKPRHPLFGADYQKNITLSSDVEQKLDAAIEKLIREEKKRRKRAKKAKERLEYNQSTNQVIFDLLNQTSTNVTVKTEKDSYETILQSGSQNAKSKKKTKQSLINESIQDVISQLNITGNTHKKYKKKKSVEISQDIKTESFSEDSNKTKTKHDKHKKANKGIEFNSLTEIYENTEDSNTSCRKRKDSKSRSEMVNSTLMPGASGTFELTRSDISQIPLELSAKKTKKKEGKDSLISDLLGNIKVNVNYDADENDYEETPKKSKKHKLPVSDDVSQSEPITHKKKKRKHRESMSFSEDIRDLKKKKKGMQIF